MRLITGQSSPVVDEAYVDAEIAALKGGASAGADTLEELETAVNTKADAAATAAALAGKSALSHTHNVASTQAAGFMSTGDRTKLDGIEAGADVTDWAGVSAVIPSTSNAYGTRTVSTGDPTGGSDGDIWYKVT